MFFYFFLVLCIFVFSGHVCFAAEVYYLHPDQLGGIGVVTDQRGRIDELLDYYPFGALRLDQTNSTHNEKRKFIGQEYDGSDLSYLNARYYDSRLGKFISQDPQFWSLADIYLSDPQQFNSYSYGRNNPISYIDPWGLSSATYIPMPLGGWQIGQAMGQFNGVTAYYNGIGSSSITRSCVEYAKRYASQVYGINNIGKVGDAKTMWTMVETINSRLQAANSPYTFTRQENGSDSLPREGDLLFSTEGKYGHVMVVTETKFDAATGKGHVEIIDQNASNKAVRNLDLQKTDKGYTVMKANGAPLAGWFSRSPVKSAPVATTNSVSSRPSPSLFQKVWHKAKQFVKGLFKR